MNDRMESCALVEASLKRVQNELIKISMYPIRTISQRFEKNNISKTKFEVHIKGTYHLIGTLYNENSNGSIKIAEGSPAFVFTVDSVRKEMEDERGN